MRMSWLVALALLGVNGIGKAELVWQAGPGGLGHNHQAAEARTGAAGSGERHEHGGRGEGTVLYLESGEGVSADLWTPTLERLPIDVATGGRVTVRPTGLDNYHLLRASRETDGRLEMALRYLPRNGRPTGRSPTELTAAVKGPLEIVPAPLPREHRHYIADADPAQFVVRYEGRPLAGALVQLQTSMGSLREAMTDAEGRVGFVLPDDFPEVRPGRRANPPAEFVVRVAHREGEKSYWTTLSASYHVNPAYWQSTEGGVAIAAIGFLAGLLWVRTSGNNKPGGSA